jgi:hypothetical protein
VETKRYLGQKPTVLLDNLQTFETETKTLPPIRSARCTGEDGAARRPYQEWRQNASGHRVITR